MTIVLLVLTLVVASAAYPSDYFICYSFVMQRNGDLACVSCQKPVISDDIRRVNSRNACPAGLGMNFTSLNAAKRFEKRFCNCAATLRITTEKKPFTWDSWGMIAH
jgi:hypothetical protein